MLIVNRQDIIERMVTRIKDQISDFKLVRPYQGELDRYFKQRQIRAPEFPAEVNLLTPFALVISKSRDEWKSANMELRCRHNLSVYVGVANEHNLGSEEMPSAFELLSKCVDALHDWDSKLTGCGVLTLRDDGEYITTTDLFTVYDQKWFQLEIVKTRR